VAAATVHGDHATSRRQGSPDRVTLRENGGVLIYKLLDADEWRDAQAAGQFRGSAVDLADGYVHFSTADQVVETAARHFSGRRGIVLLAVDAGPLGDDLRWEASRGGALFPHLYAPLPTDVVLRAVELLDDLPVEEAVVPALEDPS
jgi:uncharacterized protein (DUF952 family)